MLKLDKLYSQKAGEKIRTFFVPGLPIALKVSKNSSHNQNLLGEYFILKYFLGRKLCVPRVFLLQTLPWFNKVVLVEEKVVGRVMDKRTLIKTLPEIASVLKTIHNLPIPSSLKEFLRNDLLRKGKFYSSMLVYQRFFSPYEEKIKHLGLLSGSSSLNEKMVKLATKLERPFRSIPVGIIHGDLSAENIISTSSSFRIVDWGEARLDGVIIDLAQIVYHFDLDESQTNRLLSIYSLPQINRTLLEFSLLLIYLWDFCYGKSPQNKKWETKFRYVLKGLFL